MKVLSHYFDILGILVFWIVFYPEISARKKIDVWLLWVFCNGFNYKNIQCYIFRSYLLIYPENKNVFDVTFFYTFIISYQIWPFCTSIFLIHHFIGPSILFYKFDRCVVFFILSILYIQALEEKTDFSALGKLRNWSLNNEYVSLPPFSYIGQANLISTDLYLFSVNSIEFSHHL